MIEIAFGSWKARIATQCGGNLVSLQWEGEELLRSPESLAVLQGRPCMYGFPLILPANRVADGVFTFAGKQYRLTINEPAWNNHVHGLLRDAPFLLLEHKENYARTLVKNRGEYYPFHFDLYLEDILDEDGWLRRMTLVNVGPETMPYTVGFHAVFREPEWVCVPISQWYEIDDRFIPTGALLPLTAQQRAYRDGVRPDGRKFNGSYTSGGHTVQLGDFQMTVSEQFDHWVVFNGNGDEGYLCVEPQCGAVNGLKNGIHRTLNPGDKEVFTLRIQKNDGK